MTAGLLAAASAVLLSACTGHSAPVRHSTGSTASSMPASTVTSTAPVVASTQPRDPEPPSGALRNTIAIPALHETAPIDVSCIDHDGLIDPPSTDPRRTCVWDGGAAIGAATGTEMILGHINYSGVPGALGKIGKLRPGARIYLWDAARRRSVWQVTTVRQRAKAAGVDPPAEVGRRGAARLALVTCGGKWVGGEFGYADLVYVYAAPV